MEKVSIQIDERLVCDDLAVALQFFGFFKHKALFIEGQLLEKLDLSETQREYIGALVKLKAQYYQEQRGFFDMFNMEETISVLEVLKWAVGSETNPGEFAPTQVFTVSYQDDEIVNLELQVLTNPNIGFVRTQNLDDANNFLRRTAA